MTAPKADPIAAIEDAIHALNDRAAQVERDHLIDALRKVNDLVDAELEFNKARAAYDSLQDGVSTYAQVYTADRALANAKLMRAAALAPFLAPSSLKATET